MPLCVKRITLSLHTLLMNTWIIKIFEAITTNCIKSSNPIYNICYMLLYLHLDVRRDLFHNIHGTVIYI